MSYTTSFNTTSQEYEKIFNICRADLEINSKNKRSDLEKAIKEAASENTAAIDAVYNVGKENFALYLNRFGNPVKGALYFPLKPGKIGYANHYMQQFIDDLTDKGIDAKITKNKIIPNIIDSEVIVNIETCETKHSFYT
jgi:hypothetical protein